MTSAFRNLAAAATTTAILGGTAMAQDDPTRQMIDVLKLPVGDTSVYFNAATQNVVVEKCAMGANNSGVVCDLRVLGAAAIMDYNIQGMTYSVGPDGQYSVTPGNLSQDQWSNEFSGGDYKSLKKTATQAEWSASSPLATAATDGTVIQNDIRVTHMIGAGQYRAEAFSSIPISENRGINLRQSFEDKASAVSSVEMNVSNNGALLSVNLGEAERDFTAGDYDFVERYYKDSQSPYARFER